MPVDPSILLFSEAFRRYLAATSPFLLRILVARSPRHYSTNVMGLWLLRAEAYQWMIAPAAVPVEGVGRGVGRLLAPATPHHP